jgi:hypothetical protein
MNTDAGKTAELKGAMIRGLIGLFISVAVWGIIDLASNITGVTTGNNPQTTITCPPGLVARGGICQ